MTTIKDTDDEKDLTVRALVQSVQEKIAELAPKNSPEHAIFRRGRHLGLPNTAVMLTSFVGATLAPLTVEERQQILETVGLKQRLELDFLQRESQALRVSTQISESIQRSRDQEMRHMALQRQAQEIQRELQRLQQKKDKFEDEGHSSEEEEEDELAHLGEKLSKANLPEDAKRIAKKELKRLKSLQAHHPEYTSTHSYLELLASLPWNNQTKESFDLQEARRLLDEDHRGLEKVKIRILEFLAVQKLRGLTGKQFFPQSFKDRVRGKQKSEVSCHDRPDGLSFGPLQSVQKALKELEDAGFGRPGKLDMKSGYHCHRCHSYRQKTVMDMGCAYHDFSKGLLRIHLNLECFPEVLSLIERSMKSMNSPHLGLPGLNVIARHYEGPSQQDRLAFHADNFVVDERVFGCILRQEGQNPNLALHFRERDGHGYVRMQEIQGHLYQQTGEARHHWSHGIPAGGEGLRQSLTWRWLRPSFLRWCELEDELNRKQQMQWLLRFVAGGIFSGIDHEVLEQFLTRWLPVCSPAREDPLLVPETADTKILPSLPASLVKRLRRSMGGEKAERSTMKIAFFPVTFAIFCEKAVVQKARL
eukprot:symbB.v1.2.016743.t1/scaffold1277.1/size127245/7